MTTLPPDDQSGQEPRPQPAAGEQPLTPEQELQLRHAADQAAEDLHQARAARAGGVPAGAEWYTTRTYRGKPKGHTHDPAFLTTVAEAAWTYRDVNGTTPAADELIHALGVGRTAYFTWLANNHLNSADVKIAASKRTLADSVSCLTLLQQERRHQNA